MEETRVPDVGARIRTIRESRELSLRALADRCGLSINAISLIERGSNSPTVSSLHALASALGVPITDFFREVDEQTAVHVKRDQRLAYQGNGILMESLGIGLRNQQLEPFLITIEPEAGSDEPVTHPGQEFVHCLSGQADYVVGNDVYPLTSGDSLLLDAVQPHHFRNSGYRRTRLLVVFQAQERVDLARERHLEAREVETERAWARHISEGPTQNG